VSNPILQFTVRTFATLCPPSSHRLTQSFSTAVRAAQELHPAPPRAPPHQGQRQRPTPHRPRLLPPRRRYQALRDERHLPL
jgi:hypothetical protein